MNQENIYEITPRTLKQTKLIYKLSRKWTHEEDLILKSCIKKYEKKINWKEAQNKLPRKTKRQICLRHKILCKKHIRGLWTKEEDELIENLIKKVGRNWTCISNFISHRSEKQIRNRYINVIDKSE